MLDDALSSRGKGLYKRVSSVLVFILLLVGSVTRVNPAKTMVNKRDYAGSPKTPATTSVYGPRMNGLLIKYFNSSISSPFDALLSDEVDLTDLDVWWNQTRTDLLFGDSNVQAAISPSAVIIQFDFKTT